mmetsp:Transcript_105694/g.328239  ORF Transcript_105694/g.328239 Transcript_105694/m.328239 type:complete len:481 (+) Transcript_105694:80-1522(+)
MGNQIRCCSSCHSDSLVLAQHNSVTETSAQSVPVSALSKHGSRSSGSGAGITPLRGCGQRGPGTWSLGSERGRLRCQVRAFIADATDTVPVSFVDLVSSLTRVGSYTLDLSPCSLVLDENGVRSTILLRDIVDVLRPEDCLAWERAGHSWPSARLRRLVIVSLLNSAGDSSLHAWLEADEARRDRCIISLSVLAAPHPEGHSGAASGAASKVAIADAAAMTGLGPELICDLSTGLGTSSTTSEAWSLAAAGHEARAKALARFRPEQTLGNSAAPVSAADVTAEALRRLTRHFARDAAEGVEGVFWVDMETGLRMACVYQLNPASGELAFRAAQGSGAHTTLLHPSSCHSAEMPFVAPKGASPSSGSTTAASSPRLCPGARASPACYGEHQEGGTGAAPAAPPVLGSLHLSRVHEVWRPERRPHFAEAHAWYAPLTPEERACLVCVDHGPLAPNTLCLLERDATARERFVVCMKVLRLSVS